jgi:RsiW-degrading membrane proteinase PrsW (M82 family)
MNQTTNAVTNFATSMAVSASPQATTFSIMLLLLFLAFGLLLFAFWIWMLVDAIKNPKLNGNQKLIWVLVIVFLNWIGALVYFFAGRNKLPG